MAGEEQFLSEATEIPQFPDTTPRQDIRREGDFYIEYVKLIAFNGVEYKLELLNLEFSIYEDLFSHTMSGHISFQDSSDLPQLLPLIGQELVKFRFTRPAESGRGLLDEYYEMEFRVYKMDSRRPETQKFNIQNYTLHLVSKELITDLKKKIWRTYVDMPYAAMVEKIFNEFLESGKSLEFEPTMYDFKYAASGLSPFQTISILASRSISSEGNGCFYTFYEDMDKFNFVTVGKLMKQAPEARYLSQMANVLEDQGSVKQRDRTIDEDMRRVENYLFTGSFDVVEKLQNGMYAQQLIAVDTLRKIWKKYDWDYKAEFEGLPHLDVADIHTADLDALGSPPTVMRLMETTKDHDTVPWIAAREPGIKPNHIEEYVLKRASQLQQTLVNKLHVNVSGDPRRRVGKVIEFMLPNHYGTIDQFHRPDPPQDRYLAGKYLIVGLKHRLEASKYYCEMEIVKDSFAQEIEAVDAIDFQKHTW